MKAQTLEIRNYGHTVSETIKKMMEEYEMKAANAITTVNNWLSHSWLRKTPGKVLGALAVGGLMMTAAVLTPYSAFADEPSRPLGIEASQEFGPLSDWIAAALLGEKQPFWGYGPVDDMATAALLGEKQPFWGYGSIDDMAINAALLATDPSRAPKLDTRIYTYEFHFAEDRPARAPKLDTRLYTNGIDFVEDSPARAPKLDTRLYTNGIDFVDEPGAGKVSYSERADFGPLSDMIAAAELNSARPGDYIFWADFPN